MGNCSVFRGTTEYGIRYQAAAWISSSSKYLSSFTQQATNRGSSGGFTSQRLGAEPPRALLVNCENLSIEIRF
jgi:hypothetical protein